MKKFQSTVPERKIIDTLASLQALLLQQKKAVEAFLATAITVSPCDVPESVKSVKMTVNFRVERGKLIPSSTLQADIIHNIDRSVVRAVGKVGIALLPNSYQVSTENLIY